LHDQLLAEAGVDGDYVALIVVSSVVAALGLEQNSAATIIGAMVVAPLMLPIRALGYGLLRFDGAIIAKALVTISASVALTVGIGTIVGWVSQRPEFGSEILSRTSVTFLGLGVALAGGTLAGLSRSLRRSRITDSLVGVGISVSLVPPLCATGILLAYAHWSESSGAFMIFLTNLIGISLACAIVFWFSGHAVQGWRTPAGMVVFAVAVLAILPVLAQAAYRARQISIIEAFLARHGIEYLPSLVTVEGTSVTWSRDPAEVITIVRSQNVPTREQVRKLNKALNDEIGKQYHLSIVADPAVTIVP
jgi:uncharacterized hydrophobic protein (TIGR00271 family)